MHLLVVAVEGEHRLCHARIRDVERIPALQHVDVRAERIAEFEERKRLQLRFARGRKAVDHLLAREALADLRGKAQCWSTKLRLVASNRNDRLDMTIQLNKQNDDATEVGKENIVNGFSDSALTKDAEFKEGTDNAYTVYEIDLTKWFSFGNDGDWTGVAMDVDGKKYLGETSKWKNPYEGTNAAVTVADGAVLAGEFVIPFDKDETLNTFELQLVGKKKGNDQGKGFATDDNDKEYILQTWSVKLDDASIDATLKDTEYHYSIYRNHLYQIGKRGGGDDPDKPGVDPDKPQPLDKSQELVIKINDQWEFIHDLEID